LNKKEALNKQQQRTRQTVTFCAKSRTKTASLTHRCAGRSGCRKIEKAQ